MALLRFLAWLLLLVAMIVLVSDLTRIANGGPLVFTTSLGFWKSVSPQTLAAATISVPRYLHPLLWDPIAMRVLLLPVWFLIGALGLVFAVLGRKKRRVNIFAN